MADRLDACALLPPLTVAAAAAVAAAPFSSACRDDVCSATIFEVAAALPSALIPLVGAPALNLARVLLLAAVGTGAPPARHPATAAECHCPRTCAGGGPPGGARGSGGGPGHSAAGGVHGAHLLAPRSLHRHAPRRQQVASAAALPAPEPHSGGDACARCGMPRISRTAPHRPSLLSCLLSCLRRPYLRQRTHSAVCYLQTAGTDFEGGTFQFQSPAALGSGGSSGGGGGGPVDVLAAPGRVVAYDAQQQHGVMRVLAGERCALTLWFTADPQHSEDARLLARMAGGWGRAAWCGGGAAKGSDSASFAAANARNSALCHPSRNTGAGAPQRPLPLPASMYRLPDGTDLRLCRLAMAGLALVHAGRLLHSAEDVPEQGDGAGVQLAVQPPALQAWLDWQADAASRGGRAGVQPAAEQQPAAGAALVLGSIRFSSVQEAVLAAQRWCWRRCPGGWSRERVCCAHLCQPPANAQHRHQAHSCAWLRSCQLGSSQLSSNGAAAAELSTQVAAAAAASRKWLDSNGAALAALQPQWLQLGALFLEEDVAAV